MVSKKQEFNIDRESLQEALGAAADRNLGLDEVLAALEGREIRLLVRDEKFEQITARVVINRKAGAPAFARLWVEDWKGVRQKEPWGIKILEIVEQ